MMKGLVNNYLMLSAVAGACDYTLWIVVNNLQPSSSYFLCFSENRNRQRSLVFQKVTGIGPTGARQSAPS